MRLLLLLLLCLTPVLAQAEIQVNVPRVTMEPLIDGDNSDPVWLQTKPLLINDQTAKETILLSAVHTDERIYFLVMYQDKAENPLHKPWTWDEEQGDYVEGSHREDTFVFKWNMMEKDVNLSNFSEDDYRADVWYWKANRTNLSGYADDKMQILSGQASKGSQELKSPNGMTRYLSRISDKGSAPYTEYRPESKSTAVVNRYLPAQPSGSRADVEAKGRWVSGFWFIEFSRKLQTGYADDLQLTLDKSPLFGVSIFSLYGNKLDMASPNLYGKGRISEPLRLHLLK